MQENQLLKTLSNITKIFVFCCLLLNILSLIISISVLLLFQLDFDSTTSLTTFYTTTLQTSGITKLEISLYLIMYTICSIFLTIPLTMLFKCLISDEYENSYTKLKSDELLRASISLTISPVIGYIIMVAIVKVFNKLTDKSLVLIGYPFGFILFGLFLLTISIVIRAKSRKVATPKKA